MSALRITPVSGDTVLLLGLGGLAVLFLYRQGQKAAATVAEAASQAGAAASDTAQTVMTYSNPFTAVAAVVKKEIDWLFGTDEGTPFDPGTGNDW